MKEEEVKEIERQAEKTVNNLIKKGEKRHIEQALILKTNGFSCLEDTIQSEIMKIALQNINPKTDFIVFTNQEQQQHKEDNGRSLIIPFNVSKKVYVKLDDYGSVEALRENSKLNVNSQYAITFMLAEEY